MSAPWSDVVSAAAEVLADHRDYAEDGQCDWEQVGAKAQEAWKAGARSVLAALARPLADDETAVETVARWLCNDRGWTWDREDGSDQPFWLNKARLLLAALARPLAAPTEPHQETHRG